MDIVKEASKIYDLLQDEESKNIFMKQLMFHISSDYRYIFNMVEDYVGFLRKPFTWESFLEDAKLRTQNCRLYVYGAGGEGKALKSILEINGIQVEGFVDKNYSKINHLKVISPDDFVSLYSSGNVCVTIGSEMYYTEINDYLIERGISPDDILGSAAIPEYQYFDNTIIKYVQDEVFVDCGSLDLQTCEFFTKNCTTNIKQVFAIEPDKENLLRCRQKIEDNNLKYELLPFGVWSSDETLKFNSAGGGTSRLEEDGTEVIEVRKLDTLLKDVDVTFIKMDIEGAELEALKGAEKTIKQKKPKLAISVYHKPEDFLTIPKLIHDFAPDYKLYMRHYSIFSVETVLYAVL